MICDVRGCVARAIRGSGGLCRTHVAELQVLTDKMRADAWLADLGRGPVEAVERSKKSAQAWEDFFERCRLPGERRPACQCPYCPRHGRKRGNSPKAIRARMEGHRVVEGLRHEW